MYLDVKFLDLDSYLDLVNGMLMGLQCEANSYTLICAYLDNRSAGHSDMTRSQWQSLLTDAYEKKFKVLMAMGHYSSAVHFGHLSAVLDASKSE